MSLKNGNDLGRERTEKVQDIMCSEIPSSSLSRLGGNVGEKDKTCSFPSCS
jgi:hypothetical protein